MVSGFDLALLALREGERAVVGVPAALAYGAKGKPPKVPPNTPLSFEMEVSEVIRDGGARLSSAAALADGDAVRELLAEGVRPDAMDSREQTPLHAAADAAAAECLYLLLERAASLGVLAKLVDAQAARPKGVSALHLAVRARDELCVSLLLHAGASVELQTEKGTTPIKQATDYKNEQLLQLLQRGRKCDTPPAGTGDAPECVLCGCTIDLSYFLGIGAPLCREAERLRASALWAARLRNTNPRVWMLISCAVKGKSYAESELPTALVEFELWSDVVPRTAENFRQLCTGEAGRSKAFGSPPLCYKGCAFHRIVPGQIMQGGDFTLGNGRGGESIYGLRFDDESFRGRAGRHSIAGLLSMANSGRNSNGSQFFITLSEMAHLDGKHVVFGRVTKGLEQVIAIASVTGSSGGDVSAHTVRVEDCGQY